MTTFVNSISGVLVILVMVMVGYVLAKKGWFDDQTPSLIAKLVTKVALPCYMIYTIVGRFTADELLKMLPQLRFPTLSMIILLAIAMAVAQLFAVDKKHQGLFVSMFFNSNTIFVGLPINQALFGDKSIPYVLVYYMCNTTFATRLSFGRLELILSKKMDVLLPRLTFVTVYEKFSHHRF